MDDFQLSFSMMTVSDIPEVTLVMKRAFDDDAQKHNGDFFRQWLLPYDESVGYKIIAGEEIFGGIIVWILPEAHNILGTVFVNPDYQD